MKLEKVWPNQRQIFSLWSLGLRDWDYSNWFHSRRSQLVVARQEKGGKSWYFWSGFLSNANSVIRWWRRVSVQMFACTPTCCVCADATLNPAHASVWRKRYILGFAGLNVGQVRVHDNKNKQGYNQWQDTGGHQCTSSFQHKLPAGLLGKPDDSEMKTQDTGIPQLLACEVDHLSTLWQRIRHYWMLWNTFLCEEPQICDKMCQT